MSPSAPPSDPTSALPAVPDDDPTGRDVHRTVGLRPSPLSLTALTLAGTGALLGITLLWAFVALPVSIAAVVCALLARRPARRVGLPAHPVETVAVTLGMVAVVLSLSSLLAVPLLRNELVDVNDGVQEDLRSVERSFRGSVDALDRTMTRNVDVSARSLRRDFDSLERNSKEELAQVESQLRALLDQVQADVRTDLENVTTNSRAELGELERSLREDDRAYVEQLRSLQDSVRSEAARMQAQIDRIEEILERIGAA